MTLPDYLKTSEKTHLIFDFDETLIKLILPWEKAIEKIRKELASLDETICKDYEQGKIPFSLLQNKYVSLFGKKALDLLIKNEIEFEKNCLEGVIVNKELIDFVKNLSGRELLIWSSNTKPTINKFLRERKVFEKFKKIVSREDVKLLKPEIDGFNLLYDSKVSKKNYLFIGDSKFDRVAAKSAGIDFYFV